ncbi:hypothetical protein ABB37_00247 [Leptomonas pyrrhocoris]|uniref:Uncharacterized protein n=1 Tax=Leptomonas pyrrhocoris TaxID=157538 RepID=A0A0M9GA87_LEPPY|nr:hypothetical protein ABB37_00247 [Leptomonas pyrrhocoris]XP_015664388.1 hypothetical protein ABB37_00247 [Leptomonas pyrrhocoris]KPA85948.1 hypothetical protein ABB37_00247 [Leptomonas pyrrhocoris]KPA85949.1 hypothetical protein ABB37_00247 [Leptomonas pyrrhocoris]|eukprot:XP_015664387.1 hypothetical protein ABB37_00247 [Leptomonas pyrrhocoris]
MSYAQRHRTRVELHQSSLGPCFAPLENTPTRNAPSPGGDQVPEGGPRPRSNSALRAHAARIHQVHATGIDIATWSDAASNAVAGERQPFQLLQRTPPKNEPPRLKASRKQFASPHVSVAPPDSSQSVPVALPIVLNGDSLEAPSKHEEEKEAPATDLRIGGQTSAAPAAAAAPADTDKSAPSQAHPGQHSEVLPAGEMSPSPIPVLQQLFQPQPADSSVPSSARASTSQWPASETFTARLRNIMETRQQIEALVQKQRADEEEMVRAIGTLDEQSPQRQSQQQSPNSAAAAAGGSVSPQAYEQVLMERAAAFAALREFKEKGNAIVHHLYDTVRSQQEQSLELVATVEALKKANKRLKEAVSNGGGTGARTGDSTPTAVPGTAAELQQKVLMQRRVIEQMDQLMQNADRMLLAMRARVEAAERRAAASTAPLDRRQLPPLSKGGGSSSGTRTTTAGDGGPAMVINAATVATPDAVAAIERLSERYPVDQDVATVAAQQRLLLERITQLRQSLKEEEAQRLHLEEVYGATSEETARNVALLEERLQRAENPRVVQLDSASNASALRRELHTLLEEKGKSTGEAAPVEPEDAGGQRSLTHSHASSHASSRSSTPTHALFTAVSVGDVNSTTAANELTGGDVEKKKLAPSAVAAPVVPDPANEAATAVTAMVAATEMKSPVTPNKDESSSPHKEEGKQARTFLGRREIAGSDKNEEGAAAEVKPPLGIPVPDASSLGNSLHRSANSRSSSASRRLVGFRRAAAADVLSRGLESMSDVEGEEETVDVDVEPSEMQGSNGNGIAGVTPTAIHSASSPLPDASTSVELSVKRQQRLHQQMEELTKMEADVTNVVRSLNVE